MTDWHAVLFLQVWYKANNIDNTITNLIPQSFMYLNGFVLI